MGENDENGTFASVEQLQIDVEVWKGQ